MQFDWRKVRAKLGLPDDADEKTTMAALSSFLEMNSETKAPESTEPSSTQPEAGVDAQIVKQPDADTVMGPGLEDLYEVIEMLQQRSNSFAKQNEELHAELKRNQIQNMIRDAEANGLLCDSKLVKYAQKYSDEKSLQAFLDTLTPNPAFVGTQTQTSGGINPLTGLNQYETKFCEKFGISTDQYVASQHVMNRPNETASNIHRVQTAFNVSRENIEMSLMFDI